jgi:hypothetical protein
VTDEQKRSVDTMDEQEKREIAEAERQHTEAGDHAPFLGILIAVYRILRHTSYPGALSYRHTSFRYGCFNYESGKGQSGAFYAYYAFCAPYA